MIGEGMNGMHGAGGMSGPMWMPDLPPTLARLLAVHPQPVPILPVLGVVLLGLYVAGVLRLRRRGVRWPVGRSVAWLLGISLLWAVTATGVEAYGMMLMSVHMIQHMMLTMVVPIVLLLGSPVALALRALPARGRGSGVRSALVRTLRSRPFALLASIPSRWFLFLSGLYAIYFTPIFDDLMSNVWGHNLMLLHFLGTGLLFFAPLVGADPLPGKAPHLLRMLETFASTPFHAFFGIAFMMATTPVVMFFTDPPASWGIDVMSDQNTAGGIAWVFAEVPTMLVMGVIFVQWVRSEQRAEAREARSVQRGDDELAAYNAYLAELSRRDG
ncbi:MAG: cytochrome c oxidase assembly protein [Nocardioidaceae bacterium]